LEGVFADNDFREEFTVILHSYSLGTS
jgi:hypothetical protein